MGLRLNVGSTLARYTTDLFTGGRRDAPAFSFVQMANDKSVQYMVIELESHPMELIIIRLQKKIVTF